MSDSLAKALPFLLAAMVFPFVIGLVLTFNYTPSMPYGFYLRLPLGEVRPGVLVQMDNPLPPGSFGVWARDNLLKRVERVLPDGGIEVQGDSPLSYDSDFFGLVDRSLFEARLVPLLTWTDESERMCGLFDRFIEKRGKPAAPRTDPGACD